jgi:hypothetical protein
LALRTFCSAFIGQAFCIVSVFPAVLQIFNESSNAC